MRGRAQADDLLPLLDIPMLFMTMLYPARSRDQRRGLARAWRRDRSQSLQRTYLTHVVL